jgi:maleylpyruvate isomerase
MPHLEETVQATSRYLATVRALTDDDVRMPSVLPGWSRGHVVTHVARNADGLANLLHWGLTGEERAQYPSQEARDEDIEAGAGRRAADLLADAEASADRWESLARMLRPEQWENGVARVPGSDLFPVRRVGVLRRTEVEVHHADLGAGYTSADWPADFVAHLLKRRVRELTDAGTDLVLAPSDGEEVRIGASGPEVCGTSADLVWWLLGRGSGQGLSCSESRLPDLGRWT